MFSDAVSEDPLQLGHLKQSAVARLLVQGRLPSPPKQHGASACEEPPMDLSTRSLVNTGCGDMTSSQLRINEEDAPMPAFMEHLHQTITNEMSQLMKQQYSAGMEWKCCFCPYTAKDRSKLLSHYQFHQQLLTSSSPASRSHYEWLSAYRQSRDYHHKLSPEPEMLRPKSVSPGLISTQNTPHLRNLLTKTQQLQQQENSPPASASGFLRSIVQTIMQQNNGARLMPHAPGQASAPLPTDDKDAASEGSSSGVPVPNVKEENDSEADDARGLTEAPSPSLKREADDVEAPERPQHCKRRRRKKNATLDDVVRGLASSTTHQTRDDLDADPSMYSGRHFVNQQLRCLLNQRTSGRPALSESPPSTTVSPVHSDRHLRSVLASPPAEQHSCNTQALISSYEAAPRKLSDSEGDDASRPAPTDYFIGEAQEGQCAVITRCDHCGITFDDEVLFSIHMGCHSHQDPFICNVCGRSCENKYAFYTHIMRGHQNMP